MSLDTAQKRASVFQLPGLMMNPNPAGSVSKADRHQMADLYMGIESQIPNYLPNQTCWVPSLNPSGPWRKAGSGTSNWGRGASNSTQWMNEADTSKTWVREETESDKWVPEKEINPC